MRIAACVLGGGACKLAPFCARMTLAHVDCRAQAWDATQIKRSTAKVGAADKRGDGQMGEGAGDYDLVMAQEEQIEFISDELIAGTIGGEGGAEPPKKPTTQQTLAEVRKTLPVFAYRDEIIAAVREHPVLIIVGETGMHAPPLPLPHGARLHRTLTFLPTHPPSPHARYAVASVASTHARRSIHTRTHPSAALCARPGSCAHRVGQDHPDTAIPLRSRAVRWQQEDWLHPATSCRRDERGEACGR